MLRYLLVFFTITTGINSTEYNSIEYNSTTIEYNSTEILYNNIEFDSINESLPSYEIFKIGYEGYQKYSNKISNEKLTIVDFDLSSNIKRMWIIDIVNQKVLYHTFTSHGANSGGEYAKKFSNKIGSNMSSLGFYITSNTYKGSHGLSLELDGLETINSNLRKRRVVMHPAEYIKKMKSGYLGRSQGCLTLDPKISKEVINTIKDGSIIFVYNQKYK